VEWTIRPLLVGRTLSPRWDRAPRPPGCGVNLCAQDLIVISTALVGVIGNAYLFVAAVHDGHRALYRAAGVAFFVFSLVGAVFFVRAM
jgi:hypothetical protein